MTDTRRWYKIEQLKKIDQLNILKEAIACAKQVVLDELDCTKSIHREKTDTSIEEALGILQNSIFRVFRFVWLDFEEKYQIVVRFSDSERNRDLFFWVDLKDEDAEALLKKYSIEQW